MRRFKQRGNIWAEHFVWDGSGLVERTPLAANQGAMHCRSVPGKQYGVRWAETLAGPWNRTAVVVPTTTQKRLVLDEPAPRTTILENIVVSR